MPLIGFYTLNKCCSECYLLYFHCFLALLLDLILLILRGQLGLGGCILLVFKVEE